MSQTNAIILRIKADRAEEFERLFKKHQYPNWIKHHEKGGMLAASLTRVEYGVEEEDAKKGRYVNYIVFAKLTGQRAHDAHDSDPAFKAWDERAEQSSRRALRFGAGRRSSRSDSPDSQAHGLPS
jgi:hypothetical protein